MAASVSSFPYLIFLAAKGILTAQSQSLMVRSPRLRWATSIMVRLRTFTPSSDR